MHIALGVEYDGGEFSGWQRQSHCPSVQGELEAALSQVADEPVRTVAAGRTDAGVHATQQVAGFQCAKARPLRAWRDGVNALTAPGVKVRWARQVEAGFHARFSAAARRYLYLFLTDQRPSPLCGRYVCPSPPLDAEAMQQAGQALLGEQDFSSFRAAACQARSPVRVLHRLEVAAHGPFVHLDLEANGFLHHMARILAGTLLAVGRGERGEDWPAELLARRDRTAGGATAPPDGLYLVRVHYPPEHGIPPPPWLPDYRYDAPLTCESE